MNEQNQGASTYIQELKEVLDGLDLGKVQEAVDVIKAMSSRQGIFYTCGNGGSASTASHLVCDLVKNVPMRIKAFCLNDNMAIITALANDILYKDIFSFQLEVLPLGGLIAISTSGNSENIIQAAKITQYPNFYPVIALTGRDGGELGKIADVEIRVPSDRIQIIEDVHLSICHMVAVGLGA